MGKVGWLTYAMELYLCMENSDGWFGMGCGNSSCKVRYGCIKLVPFKSDGLLFPEVILDLTGAKED